MWVSNICITNTDTTITATITNTYDDYCSYSTTTISGSYYKEDRPKEPRILIKPKMRIGNSAKPFIKKKEIQRVILKRIG